MPYRPPKKRNNAGTVSRGTFARWVSGGDAFGFNPGSTRDALRHERERMGMTEDEALRLFLISEQTRPEDDRRGTF